MTFVITGLTGHQSLPMFFAEAMDTRESRTSFVLLRYSDSARPGDRAGFPILLVHTGDSLQVVISPAWQGKTDGEYREYLSELLSDWGAITPLEIPDLLSDLAEFSTGPLQTVKAGVIDPDQLATLVQKVSSGQLTAEDESAY